MSFSKSGKGVFGMASICMTFVPLASICKDSEVLQQRLYDSIEAGIAAKKFSLALQKQLKVQLEHIKAQEPSCELVLTQACSSKPSKSLQCALTPSTDGQLYVDLPEPKKKYITLTSLLNHPFSRGTIVGYRLTVPQFVPQSRSCSMSSPMIRWNHRPSTHTTSRRNTVSSSYLYLLGRA